MSIYIHTCIKTKGRRKNGCVFVSAEPVLMASFRPFTAVVQIKWSPVVIALTEGVLCIHPPYVGQPGRLWGTLFTILKVQDGFGSLQFSFYSWGEVKSGDFF